MPVTHSLHSSKVNLNIGDLEEITVKHTKLTQMSSEGQKNR